MVVAGSDAEMSYEGSQLCREQAVFMTKSGLGNTPIGGRSNILNLETPVCLPNAFSDTLLAL